MGLPEIAELYDYADYLEWDDGKYYELYEGEAYEMAAPDVPHQSVQMEIT